MRRRRNSRVGSGGSPNNSSFRGFGIGAIGGTASSGSVCAAPAGRPGTQWTPGVRVGVSFLARISLSVSLSLSACWRSRRDHFTQTTQMRELLTYARPALPLLEPREYSCMSLSTKALACGDVIITAQGPRERARVGYKLLAR